MIKKVSFDFDDTLAFRSIQEYAIKLINNGIEVHITTTRYEDPSRYAFETNHDDLFTVAKKLGIPKEHIHFTNFIYKWEYLKDTDFIWHLDDNDREIFFIMQNTEVKGIWSLSGDYEYRCNKLLDLDLE